MDYSDKSQPVTPKVALQEALNIVKALTGEVLRVEV